MKGRFWLLNFQSFKLNLVILQQISAILKGTGQLDGRSFLNNLD
jgi:hypothetical protein